MAEAVAANQLAFGLTDTDDAIGEIAKACRSRSFTRTSARTNWGRCSFPTRSRSSRIRRIRKRRKSFSTFLLSADVERQLAKGPSAQIPLQPGVEASTRVKTPAQVKAMEVDWSAAAAKWDAVCSLSASRVYRGGLNSQSTRGLTMPRFFASWMLFCVVFVDSRVSVGCAADQSKSWSIQISPRWGQTYRVRMDGSGWNKPTQTTHWGELSPDGKRVVYGDNVDLVGRFSLPTPMAKRPSSLPEKMATVLPVGCQTENGLFSTANLAAVHKSMQ